MLAFISVSAVGLTEIIGARNGVITIDLRTHDTGVSLTEIPFRTRVCIKIAQGTCGYGHISATHQRLTPIDRAGIFIVADKLTDAYAATSATGIFEGACVAIITNGAIGHRHRHALPGTDLAFGFGTFGVSGRITAHDGGFIQCALSLHADQHTRAEIPEIQGAAFQITFTSTA
jgi:hypothetical protein